MKLQLERYYSRGATFKAKPSHADSSINNVDVPHLLRGRNYSRCRETRLTVYPILVSVYGDKEGCKASGRGA